MTIKMAAYLAQHRHDIFNAEATSTCRLHGRSCSCCSFDLGAAGGSQMWLEVAGSTCHAWSTQGTNGRTCHESFRTFLLFINEVAELVPTVLIHECTPLFNIDLLTFFIGHKYVIVPLEGESPTLYG